MVKKVFRFEDNSAYWDRRWQESGEDAERFTNLDIYPIRYARMVMTSPEDRALELGCGLGRVLKHYRAEGFHIEGLERSGVAVERLEQAGVDGVREGDVMGMPYEDGAFDVLMAFGVLHNLEEGIDAAINEIGRVLKPGGRFCISMRPDNLEMNLNERYWRKKALKKNPNPGPEHFHKLLVGQGEFKRLLKAGGLETRVVHRARNVSNLYRVPFLRERSGGAEAERRAGGYRLNVLGRFLDGLLRRLFPYHTANVLVFIGTKSGLPAGSGMAR